MHGPERVSCGCECGPWCPNHHGTPRKLSEPISLAWCEGPGIGRRSWMGTHQRQLEAGASGWKNLTRSRREAVDGRGGCEKGANLCPEPGSTAKHLGSAYVARRGEAVLGAWQCFPPSPCNGRPSCERQGLPIPSWTTIYLPGIPRNFR